MGKLDTIIRAEIIRLGRERYGKSPPLWAGMSGL